MWIFLACPLLIPLYFLIASLGRVGWFDWFLRPNLKRTYNNPVDESLFTNKR